MRVSIFFMIYYCRDGGLSFHNSLSVYVPSSLMSMPIYGHTAKGAICIGYTKGGQKIIVIFNVCYKS